MKEDENNRDIEGRKGYEGRRDSEGKRGKEGIEKREIIEGREIQLLLDYIKLVQYGSVVVNIQDGKIVQIEKNEKVRFKN